MVDLGTAVRVGDGELVAALEHHRRELTGYCYRMLGSVFEADDAVQEVMVRAWRAHDRFEGRSSLRSWLFRIATNVCHDALRGRRRRAVPMDLGPPGTGADPAGPALDLPWITPLPAAGRTGGGVPDDGDPADLVAERETLRLAFVAALQHLEPRPRAVLILRDVLGWSAREVADLLDASPASVHSVLQRARRTLAARRTGPDAPLDAPDPETAAAVARYVDAFTSYDVAALVGLLHADAVLSMPPNALWLRGPEAIERWFLGQGSACRHKRLVPTQANGVPAFGLYEPRPDGSFAPFGVQVLEIVDGRIAGLHTSIDPSLFPRCGLPVELSAA